MKVDAVELVYVATTSATLDEHGELVEVAETLLLLVDFGHEILLSRC